MNLTKTIQMISKFEQDYKDMLKRILEHGTLSENRTGVDALVNFSEKIVVDLKDGFPIVTGKKIFFDKAYHEYRWMRDGLTTTTYLKQHDIHWWDKYANAKGELGKTYGYQLRSYNGNVDQLMDAINEVNLNSRRAYITMWNPSDLNQQALPCCYTSFNFVRIGDVVNMTMNFRSSDTFLGLPYDFIVGSLLLYDVAGFCELKVGKIAFNLDNAHIYSNHIEQVRQYLAEETFALPSFRIKTQKIYNYQSGPYIEAILNE